MKQSFSVTSYGGRFLIFLLITILPRVVSAQVQVTVDGNDVLDTVSPMIQGFGLIYSFEPDSIYDNGQMTQVFNDAGASFLRWPGGTVTTYYHWDNLTGNGWSDIWNPSYSSASLDTSLYMDLDEYITLCNQTNAEPMLGINMSSGLEWGRQADGLQEAKDLINYCISKSFDVKYFYLDNESYHSGNQYNNDPNNDNGEWTASIYATEFNTYATAIKALVPDAKLIANWESNIRNNNGLNTIISQAGSNIDYIDVHWYWKFNNASYTEWKAKTPMEFENSPWYDGGTFPEEVAYFDSLANHLGHPHIELASLEWNIAPGPWETDPTHTKFKTALMQSEMQMQFMQAGVEVASLWSTQWPGKPDTEDRFLVDSDDGYTANPTAKVFEMYKNALNGSLVSSSTNNSEIMSVVSVKDNKAYIYLLNKNNTTETVEFDVDGYSVLGVDTAWRFMDPGTYMGMGLWQVSDKYRATLWGNTLTMVVLDVSRQNLVFNGDFEEGLTNWTSTGSIAASLSDPYLGAQAAELTGNATIHQWVTVNPKTVYKISAYAKVSDPGNGHVVLGVEDDNSNNLVTINITNTNYTLFESQFVTGSNVDSVKIYFSRPPGGASTSYIDEILLSLGEDLDRDGVADDTDLDDDNDGILDLDESGCSDVVRNYSTINAGTVTFTDVFSEASSSIVTVNVIPLTGDFVSVNSGYALGRIGNIEVGEQLQVTATAPTLITVSGTFVPATDGKLQSTFNQTDAMRFTSSTGFSISDPDNMLSVNNVSATVIEITAISNTPNPATWSVSTTSAQLDLELTTGDPYAAIRLEVGCALDAIDSDNDGVPDSQDLDSDNDGIPDIVEAGGVDTNRDGKVDYPTADEPTSMVDANNNGWSSVFDDGSADASTSEGGTPLVDNDADSDGFKNRIDIDSDDDGITDVIESQPSNGYSAPSGTDSDDDGIDNTFDENNFTSTLEDTDGDLTPDIYDTDSDDDGVSDFIEAYDPEQDGTSNPTALAGADSDNDGLDNALDNYDLGTASGSTNSDNDNQEAANPFPKSVQGPVGSPNTEPNWRLPIVWWDANTNLRWENAAGAAVTLDANNFADYYLIIDEVGTVIQNNGDYYKVKAIEVQTDTTRKFNAEGCIEVTDYVRNDGTMRLTSSSESSYGQYLGPAIANLECQVVTENTGWHNIALPVIISASNFDNQNTNPDSLLINLTGVEGTHNLFSYNTHVSGGKEIGFYTGGYYSHAYGTWQMVTSGNLEGSYSLFIDEHNTKNSTPLISAKGTSRSNDVIINTSNNFGGWNLIPNPFPVSISFTLMYDNGNAGNFFEDFDKAVWIWDPSNTDNIQPGSSGGSLALYDPVTGEEIAQGGALPDNVANSGYVAPFQSFWVRRTGAANVRRLDEDGANQTNATASAVDSGLTSDPSVVTQNMDIAIKADYRTLCQNSTHYKTNLDGIKVRVVDAQNATLLDETLISFDDSYTSGFDEGYDIYRFSSAEEAPLLVSDLEGKGLAINRLPYPEHNTKVPLGFVAKENGKTYKISIPTQPEGWSIYLEDKLTGKWKLLSDGSNYRFINNTETNKTRFTLHFNKTGNIIFQQTDRNFDAISHKNGVDLQFRGLYTQHATVTVVNLAGQVIYKDQNVNTKEPYTIPNSVFTLNSGVYIVTVNTAKGTMAVKVMR